MFPSIRFKKIVASTCRTRSTIKAITVLFSNFEGRINRFDYDKKFLIKSWDKPDL